MKQIEIKHKRVLGGKKQRFMFPIREPHLRNQISEIFFDQHYKPGRRKKNSTIIDLGANIGLASLYLKDWAKHIYAIEPSPEIYKALVENTKKYKNISTHELAITNRTGRNIMYAPTLTDMPQTLVERDSPQKSIIVKTMTMEDFFKKNKIKHVDVLKIDIEEGEFGIFPDASFAAVADKIDFIVGESHHGISFPEALIPILGEYGYEVKFPKLKNHNCERSVHYKNIHTGEEKKYSYLCSTIFTAERKK